MEEEQAKSKIPGLIESFELSGFGNQDEQLREVSQFPDKTKFCTPNLDLLGTGVLARSLKDAPILLGNFSGFSLSFPLIVLADGQRELICRQRPETREN